MPCRQKYLLTLKNYRLLLAAASYVFPNIGSRKKGQLFLTNDLLRVLYLVIIGVYFSNERNIHTYLQPLIKNYVRG